MGTTIGIGSDTWSSSGKITGGIGEGVGIGLGVRITDGLRWIDRCKILAMDPVALIVISPLVKKGSSVFGLFRMARNSPIDCHS